MNPLFDLSGHGFYVWSSYGMAALALVVELLLLRARRRAAVRQARDAAIEDE